MKCKTFHFILLNHIGEKLIRKNVLIKKVATLPRGWRISFDIKPTGVMKRRSNILHATIGENYRESGDRIPGIWFNRKSTKLKICSSINDNPNQCFDTNYAMPLNTYSTVVVQQIRNAKNSYTFRVFVNKRLEVHVVNKKATTFDNVKYYTSDPWYKSALGYVKNFKLEKFEEKEGIQFFGEFQSYFFFLVT